MKPKYTTSIVFAVFFIVINLQLGYSQLKFNWVQTEGKNNSFSGGSSVKSISNGNIYVSGGIDNNIFIKRYDAVGNLVWSKTLTGGGLDYSQSLTVDEAENIYITGYFQNSLDFDPGTGTTILSSKGKSDAYILSLTRDGNFRWAYSFGSTENDWGFGVNYDNKGHIYATGYFEETVDFDPSTGVDNRTSLGASDIFILKLDTLGNYIWAKSMGGSSFDIGHTIINDTESNIYLAGYFFSTNADFDPSANTFTMSSNGNRDIFILKLDSSGKFEWANSYGNSKDDRPQGIVTDSDNNIYFTGFFQQSVDFDPTSNTDIRSAVGLGSFIQKLNPTGNVLWTKTLTDNAVWARNIAIDLQENLFITGDYNRTIDFDPNTGISTQTAKDDNDIFILKLDSSGKYIFSTSVGGDDDDNARAIAVDERENIFITGGFRQAADFDPDTIKIVNKGSSGLSDFYILKLSSCSRQTSSSINPSVCEDYLSPAGNIYTESGTYVDVIANQNNCDSIITINLTRNEPTSSTNQLTACKQQVSPSGIYIWTTTGNYIDTIPNQAGCDSIITIQLTVETIDTNVQLSNNTLQAPTTVDTYQWINCDSNSLPITGATSSSFTPAKNGNYAVILTKNGCTDTSACISVTTVSVEKILLQVGIEVYPNPVNDKINILCEKELQQAKILIYNQLGQIVFSKSYTKAKDLTIDFNKDEGIYFLEIITPEGYTSTQKLLKF